MPPRQCRAWVFTLFGSTSDELRGLLQANGEVVYFCYQEEVCPETERDHLQGYLVLRSKRALGFLRRLIPNAHFENRRGTHQEAKSYCSKEETRKEGTQVVEWGTEPIQGRRNDIREFCAAVNSGVPISEALELFCEIFAKYPSFAALYFRYRVTRIALGQLPVLVPRLGWQRDLSVLLEGPPDPRKVHWRWESTGNTGKSFFALHYKPSETFIVTNGKHADVYFAYGGERIVFFDWPRERLDTLSYGLLESFKNGYFLNTKYQSGAFRFPVPHVIVFANFEPVRTAMSDDRWDIVEIQ